MAESTCACPFGRHVDFSFAPSRGGHRMIEASGLTKHYGSATAIEDVSFRIEPGRVTGFLGPNGAGKSTTMRLILGLHRPTRGRVTVNGRPFVKSRSPLHEV